MRISISDNYTIPTNLCVEAIQKGLFIECDTTENEITITLPNVATYSNAITVIDKTGNAGTNNIIIASAEEETIQGNETITISKNAEIVKLKPISDGLWDSDVNDDSAPKHVFYGKISLTGGGTVVELITHKNTFPNNPIVEKGDTGEVRIDFSGDNNSGFNIDLINASVSSQNSANHYEVYYYGLEKMSILARDRVTSSSSNSNFKVFVQIIQF